MQKLVSVIISLNSHLLKKPTKFKINREFLQKVLVEGTKEWKIKPTFTP